jgi:hypothetical protein
MLELYLMGAAWMMVWIALMPHASSLDSNSTINTIAIIVSGLAWPILIMLMIAGKR